MHCQRCLIEEARYRAHTDSMDIPVCASCAEEARKLEILVESLENSQAKSASIDQGDFFLPTSLKR